jgi:hypothetical protein
MHWRRKIDIGIVFSCMPAMAPLWAMALDVEIVTMIRLLTLPFLFGLLMTLAGHQPSHAEEE